jgi:hypothetical protein
MLFFGLAVIITAGFALAANVGDGLPNIIEQIRSFFKPILMALFGEEFGEVYLFEKLLFALMIIAASYMALDRVDTIRNNSFVLWTLCISVTILAVRFIAQENIIQFLLMPQGIFGIAMITVIPLALFFWFVEFGLEGARARVIRKVSWAVFAAVFIILWYKQFYLPSQTGMGFSNVGSSILNLGSWGGEWGYMYLIAAAIAGILLFADGTIQGAMHKSKMNTHVEAIKERQIAMIKKKMEDAHDKFSGEALTKRIKELTDELNEALKIGS